MREQLWRAVAVFRVVTLAYAATLIVRSHNRYAHPAAGLVVLAVMVAWTVLTIAAYARPAGRRTALVVADVAVAVTLVLTTRLVDTAGRIDHNAVTLPVFWAAAPVLAAAVLRGPWGGLLAATAVAAADGVERGALPQPTFNGIVLLFVAGVVGGYVVRLGLRSEAALAAAARAEAAAEERSRLARGIHDSVLQVLALVSRRGEEIGGEAAELGRPPAEQEVALRSLITSPATLPGDGRVDVAQTLSRLAGNGVQVVVPAQPVVLAEPIAAALDDAVAEALRNVSRHAGPAARAWVLVEPAGAEVVVTIRDDGCGFDNGRLDEAAAAGRLGVARSIVDRVTGVGGRALLSSLPGSGVEVELRVPRA